jgi:hypothetical protein
MHDKKKTKMARGGAMMPRMDEPNMMQRPMGMARGGKVKKPAMARGGMADKTPMAMARGGKVKKVAMARGGMTKKSNCGASVPAARGKK